LGLVLTLFFDLSRIASLGIILYLIMDTAIHWGVLKHLRNDIQANPVIPSLAICLNMLLLAGFILSKWQSDPMILWVAMTIMAMIWLVEYFFLKKVGQTEETNHSHH
jgi:Ca2+/Na+ antiporter